VDVDAIRAAYEALTAGETAPLVGMIHPQMEWRGRRRFPGWWKPVPS
jgi:hypothetical protein